MAATATTTAATSMMSADLLCWSDFGFFSPKPLAAKSTSFSETEGNET